MPQENAEENAMSFRLTSSAFENQGRIPRAYAQEGDNISPPLAWSDPPEGAKSFALIVEDPDAPSGLFTHWAAYDLDAKISKLPESASGFMQAANDMGHARYDGPAPPVGHGPHHYRFRLFALDVPSLDLPEPSYRDIRKAARIHAIGEAELVGIYERI
jgi:Raf kinase inhibitor-like YbhB/YbcL family protein